MTDKLDELEQIRERHEAAKQALDDERYYSGKVPAVFPTNEGKRAHADRATLLRLMDAARAELAEINVWTDDDQRGLTAAVADAMWHWDDMPMDCDDAISLTSILKNSLRDNGFQIVRLAAAVENKND